MKQNTPSQPKMATDVAVDIETMDNKPTAVITSIGASGWDFLTGDDVDEFHIRIDWRDALIRYPAFTKSKETEEWWNGQSADAKMELTGAYSIEHALDEFSDWWERKAKGGAIIGNGANFDPVILENAFLVTGRKAPWGFHEVEDMRTFVKIGRRYLGIDPKKEIPFEGVKHHALFDARHEKDVIKVIQLNLNHVKGLLKNI